MRDIETTKNGRRDPLPLLVATQNKSSQQSSALLPHTFVVVVGRVLGLAVGVVVAKTQTNTHSEKSVSCNVDLQSCAKCSCFKSKEKT